MKLKPLVIFMLVMLIGISGSASAGIEFYGGTIFSRAVPEGANTLISEVNEMLDRLEELVTEFEDVDLEGMLELDTKGFAEIRGVQGYFIGAKKGNFGLEYEIFNTSQSGGVFGTLEYEGELEGIQVIIDGELSAPISYNVAVSGISGVYHNKFSDSLSGYLSVGSYSLNTIVDVSVDGDLTITDEDEEEILEGIVEATGNLIGTSSTYGLKLGVVGVYPLSDNFFIQVGGGYRYLVFPAQSYSGTLAYEYSIILDEEYQDDNWVDLIGEETEILEPETIEGIAEDWEIPLFYESNLSGLFGSIGITFLF